MQSRYLFTVRNSLMVLACCSAAVSVAGAALAGPISTTSAASAAPRSMASGMPGHRIFGRVDPYRATCEIRMRRLVADAMAYVIDNDGRFPVEPKTFARSIVSDTDPSTIAGEYGILDGGPVFSYNTGLAGVARDSIADPAHTVLVYEGVDEHLVYRHGAKVIVAFVDGHVEELTPRQAATLRWKP